MAVNKQQVRAGVRSAQVALGGEISRLKRESLKNWLISKIHLSSKKRRSSKILSKDIANQIAVYRHDQFKLEDENGKGMSDMGSKIAYPAINEARESAQISKRTAAFAKGTLTAVGVVTLLGPAAYGLNKLGKLFVKGFEKAERYAERKQWNNPRRFAKGFKNIFRLARLPFYAVNLANKTAKKGLEERKQDFKGSELLADVIIENLVRTIKDQQLAPGFQSKRERKMREHTKKRKESVKAKEEKKQGKLANKTRRALQQQNAVAAKKEKNKNKEKASQDQDTENYIKAAAARAERLAASNVTYPDVGGETASLSAEERVQATPVSPGSLSTASTATATPPQSPNSLSGELHLNQEGPNWKRVFIDPTVGGSPTQGGNPHALPLERPPVPPKEWRPVLESTSSTPKVAPPVPPSPSVAPPPIPAVAPSSGSQDAAIPAQKKPGRLIRAMQAFSAPDLAGPHDIYKMLDTQAKPMQQAARITSTGPKVPTPASTRKRSGVRFR